MYGRITAICKPIFFAVPVGAPMWLSRLLVVLIVFALCVPAEAQQTPKLIEDILRQLREREAQIKIKSFCNTETEYCFPEGNGIWHFEDHFPDRFNTKYWKPKLIVDDQAALFKLLRQTYDKMRRALQAGDLDEAVTYFSNPEKMRDLFYQGTFHGTIRRRPSTGSISSRKS
jgi:hypothetical protein